MNTKSIFTLLMLIVFSSFIFVNCNNQATESHDDISKNLAKSEIVSKFKGKAKHGEDISIYVDFGIYSAEPRFFTYDNENDTLISKSKCAHGCGGGSTTDKPVFSNKFGSNCSSLGEYRLRCVSKLNTMNMPCIRIDGLSNTNSNAAARGIVIHEGPVLADDITIGIPIPVTKHISQGCFTISSTTFNLLCQLLKEKKSIYLYASCN